MWLVPPLLFRTRGLYADSVPGYVCAEIVWYEARHINKHHNESILKFLSPCSSLLTCDAKCKKNTATHPTPNKSTKNQTRAARERGNNAVLMLYHINWNTHEDQIPLLLKRCYTILLRRSLPTSIIYVRFRRQPRFAGFVFLNNSCCALTSSCDNDFQNNVIAF